MEMHQVRYFLTVARTLNFTRAAEQCNVSQPALTRAIRQLEEELSGELLRREGRLSHLTELGMRMLPLMQQCYESALAAKSLASSFKRGTTQALSLALSHALDERLLLDPLAELHRAIPGLRLKLRRGDAHAIGEMLRQGEVDFAIGGPLGQDWERLDAWPLFEERFELVASPGHALPGRRPIEMRELADQRFLINAHCESAQGLAHALEEHGITLADAHQVGSLHDLIALLGVNFGVAFLPEKAVPPGFVRVAVSGLDMTRQISVFGVSGRQRSAAADAILKLLRARDWSAAV
jgi:DNA-binding transcriptional LysR family regulator